MRIPVYIDIDFDLESDGEVLSEDVISRDKVEDAILDILGHHTLDHMVDAITEDTGWCIKSLRVDVE